jgi:RNA polymerase sigma factor (sigma-70 family)
VAELAQSALVLGLDRDCETHLRLERLVLDHQEALARYVRRFLGERDASLDVVQDVFLAAHRILRADANRPLTAGWLYKTATNLAISHLRRRKRRGIPVALSEAMSTAFSADESSAASLDLQRALGRLAPEQLACVMLTAYAGYSSAEAALILGINADAVRQRVCRAMRAMRGDLRETG